MLGESLGNYHVISKVGEGGMGVVYRARDQVLHRDVAIKVVPRAPSPRNLQGIFCCTRPAPLPP